VDWGHRRRNVLLRIWQVSLYVHCRVVQHSRGPSGSPEPHERKGTRNKPQKVSGWKNAGTVEKKGKGRSRVGEEKGQSFVSPGSVAGTPATLVGDEIFYTTLICQIALISTDELALPRLARYELSRFRSHGHSFYPLIYAA